MSSKIKVDTIENVAGSGNVSLGSGHNLVVPGNNSTTGNATVGGTLGVTGTSVLTGNVGIGTSASTGNNPLVVQAGSGAGGINLHGRSSDNTATMLIGKSADGNTAYNTITSYANRMRIQSGFSSDTNTIEFFTNDVSRMVIDASGHVTRTKTAGFFIGGTSAVSVADHGTGAVTYTSGNILTSSTEIDPDSVFNHSNGRFTAPVAGDYYFCFSIGVSFTSNYHYCYIRKNNSDVTGFSRNCAQNSDYLVNTIQGVMTLAANDFVTCARNTNYNGGAVVNPMFSGFLIG